MVYKKSDSVHGIIFDRYAHVILLFLYYTQSTKPGTSQQYIQTMKYRNLDMDLGNGVKTKAQLTLPTVGKGPFPAALLVPGSGAVDMNETLAKNAKPFWQIAEYLSERGFAVLRYDKRGVGENFTILNPNVWGNATANDQIQDNNKALNVLIQQPEVDPKRISIIGHSEGTLYAPRIAIDNSTKVKNIILIGVLAQNPLKDVEALSRCILTIKNTTQVLDKKPHWIDINTANSK